MNTIDGTNDIFVYCNRCHADTNHGEHGHCKKTDRVIDDASQTEVQFAETYVLLQCQVCGQARLRLVEWNSENDASPAQFFPPPSRRRPPTWLEDLNEPLRSLLKEVYLALDAGLNAIALMGVRAILDVWVSSQTTTINNFKRKLQSLKSSSILSRRQVEVLETLFDAGSAAAHRGYTPTLPDVIAATEAVENLLHQQLLQPRIDQLKSKTPPRT